MLRPEESSHNDADVPTAIDCLKKLIEIFTNFILKVQESLRVLTIRTLSVKSCFRRMTWNAKKATSYLEAN